MNQSRKNIIGFAVAAVAATAPQLSAEDAATPPPPKNWQTAAGLNLGLSGGNSETFNVGANLLTIKEWGETGANQITVGADANYGESTTTEVGTDANGNSTLIDTKNTNVNNYGGFLQYNRFLTDRLYVGGRLGGRHDEIAGVEYRIDLTANVGYYVVKQKNFSLAFEVGPGYVWEQLTGSGSNDYATIRLADNLEWKFAEKSRLFQSFEYLPQIDDFGNFVMNATVGVGTEIYKNLELQVVFRNFYRSEPAEYAGTDPVIFREKNDYQLTAGIMYKFN